ncbi:Splicing factor 45 [Galemys pyrenaicus]|uniref:Splicing factor 45 n=1 Tax=Galemys pyrenaicus TaxID=202257 RepID=A0A8J6AF23_GALPY|nr:Splicing factor 45 [Galemys pyrenaicus]
MSLYKDLGMEISDSNTEDWSKNFKLLQSQLHVTKSTLTQAESEDKTKQSNYPSSQPRTRQIFRQPEDCEHHAMISTQPQESCFQQANPDSDEDYEHKRKRNMGGAATNKKRNYPKIFLMNRIQDLTQSSKVISLFPYTRTYKDVPIV